MCHGRTLNRKIDNLHKRALWLDQDYSKTKNCLTKVSPIKFAGTCCTTELYKVYHVLTLDFMNGSFKIRNLKIGFRNDSLFATRNANVKSVHYGEETTSYLDQKIVASSAKRQ